MTVEAWLLIALLVAGYLASCLVWPWRSCPRCEGGKHRAGHKRGVWRDCRRCGGSGKRRRAGRYLIDVLNGK